jgi:hypothetical protein
MRKALVFSDRMLGLTHEETLRIKAEWEHSQRGGVIEAASGLEPDSLLNQVQRPANRVSLSACF